LGPAARSAAGKGGVSMDFPSEKAGKWMEFPKDSRFFPDFPIGKIMNMESLRNILLVFFGEQYGLS
jgi:hypothetical protein